MATKRSKQVKRPKYRVGLVSRNGESFFAIHTETEIVKELRGIIGSDRELQAAYRAFMKSLPK